MVDKRNVVESETNLDRKVKSKIDSRNFGNIVKFCFQDSDGRFSTDPINWSLIGSLIGVLALVALIICCCACCHFCCLPKYWAIYEENGPFELYHIERCTDSECQWQSRPVSSEITFLTNAKKYFSHEILNENFSDPRVHRIQLSPSCSRI
ncbi:unnamed protein product, partial [Rotaria magnacalcarata]